MHTNTTILDRYSVSTLELEHPEAEVHVLSGAQRQGDVFLLPVTTTHGGEPVPAAGVTVVRGETGIGNTHCLYGAGRWEPNPRAETDLVQGWLTVEPGGEVFLIHSQEHGALGVGAGTYEVRRQREYAGEWRRVAD